MRTLTGTVISAKMKSTVIVEVAYKKRHPRYLTAYNVRKHFAAHDEGARCTVGDTVVIEESRPLSRTKRWKVVKKMESGQRSAIAEEKSN